MKSTDRRVLRTRERLKNALIKLALEKGFEEVTIQEITELADVGYRTFFRHYQDKFELLNDVLQVILEELLQLMIPKHSATSSQQEIFFISPYKSTLLFRHAQENCDLYRLLLNSSSEIMDYIMEFSRNATEKNIEKSHRELLPIDITANHIVSSLIAMIRWWLENGMPYSPEQMGEFASILIMDPVMKVIQPSQEPPKN